MRRAVARTALEDLRRAREPERRLGEHGRAGRQGDPRIGRAVALRLLLGDDHRHVERRAASAVSQAARSSVSARRRREEARLGVDDDQQAVLVRGQRHSDAIVRGTTFSWPGEQRRAGRRRAPCPRAPSPRGGTSRRPGRPRRRGAAKRVVELLRRQPRDVEVHRQLRQQPERLGAVLAREQREAELDQALAGVARAAVPGRREERVAAGRRAAPAAAPAGRDVGALLVAAARRAELALAPLALVVDVRVAVLVQAGVTLQQLRRRARRTPPPGSPRGRAAARARRTGRSAPADARRPIRRRRRGKRWSIGRQGLVKRM